MASREEFKSFVLECLENASLNFVFSAKKMFGGCCIYVHLEAKKEPLFLLCDERFFIKCYDTLKGILDEEDKPFEKTKDWYVVDSENLTLLREVVEKVLKEKEWNNLKI